jgi:HEAT repeat protein
MFWLIQAQLKSNNVSARRKAVEKLRQMPQSGAFDLLRTAAKDPDPEVRRLAIVALGRRDEESRVEPLLAATRDRNPEVLKAAISALRRSPNDIVRKELVPFLRSDDLAVRTVTAQTLDTLQWRPDNREDEIWFFVGKAQFSQVVPFGSAAVPALEKTLTCGQTSLAVKAIEALSQIRDPRVYQLLTEALKSSDSGICATAADILGRDGNPSAEPHLAEILHHHNPQVRATVAEALGRLRAISSIETLSSLLNDPVWEVRREAAQALGRAPDARSLEKLSKTLNDEDPDVREASAIALGNVGDARAIRPLVLALKDSASGVRRIAAAALSRIDANWSNTPEARAAVEELKNSLSDEDSNVRHFVNQLFVGLGALPAESFSPRQDSFNASALAAKRRKLAVGLLEAILCDSDRDLRQAAAEALGRIGETRSRSALTRLRSDPDSGVRSAVEQALGNLAQLSLSA